MSQGSGLTKPMGAFTDFGSPEYDDRTASLKLPKVENDDGMLLFPPRVRLSHKESGELLLYDCQLSLPVATQAINASQFLASKQTAKHASLLPGELFSKRR